MAIMYFKERIQVKTGFDDINHASEKNLTKQS